MRRTPSTTSLLCLESTVRLQSFTAAAGELHLTQGAVSRQVSNLEERLGVALLIRKRDAVTLTEAGRYYLSEIAPLLQRLDRATANVMLHKGRGGVLALSVPASFASYWLIPRLPDFTRKHREITLNLTTRVGPVDFGRTSVDAAIEFGKGERPGLIFDFIMPLDLSPYAAPSWVATHGRAITAHTPHNQLIHLGTIPGAWREWFKLARIAGTPSDEGPRYELMSMAFNAAVAGLGAVLLPEFLAGDAVKTGQLRRMSQRTWQTQKGYSLLYPDVPAQPRALVAFRTWLIEQAKQ